ncbi:MAG: hypothetical protein EOL90_03095 [Spartobacteria bacterium]|nr:hypothetical protein [Spartobacteria bacterium]
MIPITNPKLAGLEPRWAPFRGFSLVFDPPEDDAFLGALRAGLAELENDALIARFYLRLLPAASFHVTAWDGVNEAKLAEVAPEFRATWERFLQAGAAKPFPEDLFRDVQASELLTCPDWDLRLRCGRIENWSNVSLVAHLEPVDDAVGASLERLRAARDALSEAFGRRFGVRPHPDYEPHVTLGYFANGDLAARSATAVARWDAALRSATAGHVLTLRRLHLSVFADMTSFGADLA